MTICGESGDVSGDTVTSWQQHLLEVLSGYSKAEIWNLDETGCFWKALPTKGFAQKAQQCKGGKKSKVRVTVTFIVNAAGEIEKPVFIWKSENLHCFKHVKKDQLPVDYYSQSKAWMIGTILHDVLRKFNCHLKRTKRSILLLMDNAGCHLEDVKGKFSNIKVIFLPANTTSMLQPLDFGISRIITESYF